MTGDNQTRSLQGVMAKAVVKVQRKMSVVEPKLIFLGANVTLPPMQVLKS